MSSIGDWPVDLLPYRWEFYLQPNTRSFQSPVTRTRQVLIGQGPRWIATGSWHFETRRKEQRFEALLDKLKGQANTVLLWDFAHKFGLPLGPMTPRSSVPRTQFTAAGSPGGLSAFTSGSPPILNYFYGGTSDAIAVHGGWALGDIAIKARGFYPNSTPLYAGDNVQIGSYLYRLTDDADANARGIATLSLNRPLLASVAAGAALVTTRARTPMQLLDDDQTRRSVDVDHVREYTVSFLEVLI